MTLVALQPCADSRSRKHFDDTVIKPVLTATVAAHLTVDTVERLESIYPSAAMPLWGATPGERQQHIKKWARLSPGDYVLFTAGKVVFAGATITTTFQSADLAHALWGGHQTQGGIAQTWELMIALENLKTYDLSYAELNNILGRKARAGVQEFQVLEEGASERLLVHLNASENVYQAVSVPPEVLFTADFDDMEQRVLAARRREQQALRSALLLGRDLACDLCGRAFPADVLTAAHIKRRAICSDAEKRQLTSVAMLNCRFGCDEVFGKGLVSVDGAGKIVLSELLPEGVVRAYAAEYLEGKTCLAWAARPSTRPFFDFHFQNDFGRPIVA